MQVDWGMDMRFVTELMEKIWYAHHPLGFFLMPVAWLYSLIVIIRRWCYQLGLIVVNQVDAYVIVVGNIAIGGTGKTPLVIWLANYLQQKGYKPGIVSRGYGGRASRRPQQVRFDSDPAMVGDEPVLIARGTDCPVAVATSRYLAAAELIQHYGCDLILCDDGLQHYALARDLEIAMVDGQRRFGNQRCLPAGPLREPLHRLSSVDLVVSKYKALRHEFKMDYVYSDLVSVADRQAPALPIRELVGRQVHAVAGIGNPNHFFSYLKQHDLTVIMHQFPDHHAYRAEDIMFNDGLLVILTEKDAVKCIDFANRQHWFLPIQADLPQSFSYRLDALMKKRRNNG